ncbi:ATP-binding protein [Elizabethkingia anophelis]|uniref:AAA family ATPase n=1 Tax=Elizabethkingia TaxID=308865 RepID=UPI0013660308|nr:MULTISPECIES: ATP-binding protein [Elizabethkingia]MCT3670799.1 ATP-binding protein [Elizabethkingia anophelis]MCT3688467.1 ATP-binding protein [Elizabethkingia anophelis]MCT3707581.1 ATP-binding protein [Elizabethkingia anophelis]MCT3714414.1 ATP-binding protein [Elizabethkingia anophelis]MCT3717833.1 ATP-binding protein [Elizabethkingia anophelis]
MQKLSPFVFGNLVNLQSFTNRENELKRLKNNLISGINTIIISPRRWGKSSLVEKTIMDINITDPDYKTVKIDLFSVNSEQEFLEKFAREVIKASSAKWEEWLKESKDIFKKLIPKFSIGIQPDSDFSISFDWEELKKYSDEILNLPEILATKKQVKFIICIDEFQNLAHFPNFEAVEKNMRAVWQKQKNVVYCLYGSKRDMMTNIFDNSSKPFYRFGDLLLLSKIKKEKWESFIVENFEKTNRRISQTFAGRITDLMKCHSWYVQQFSYYVWSETQNEVTDSIFCDALERLVQSNVPLFQNKIEEFSTGQINLLKAIAKNEKQLSSKETLKRYHLGTSAGVNKNKNTLLQKDIISEERGIIEFLDPVFELWFRKLYFDEDYLKH